MNPVKRNVMAVLAGCVIGMVVNGLFVKVGHFVIPPPEEADFSTLEGMKESMGMLKPVDYLFPFLAHALGTCAGAWVAARLAASHGMKFAIGIGFFFLAGGIAMVIQVGGPLWFKIVDLCLAYLPMGYLGGRFGVREARRGG